MAPYGENSAKDLIARFIESIGIRDEKGVVPFVRAWPDIVGNDLAAHSQVLDIKNGAVLVGLDHPAWLQRMHMERTRIVRMIQRRFPSLEVRYLHMTVVDRLDPSRRGPAAADPIDGDAPDERGPDDTTDETAGSDNSSTVTPDDGVAPQKAEDDKEFLSKLQSLEEAIRRKNGGVD